MPLSATDYESRLPAVSAVLRTYIGRRVADPHMADDVLQETLAEGYRQREALRDPAKLTAWLKTIARNRAILHLRQRRDRRWTALVEAVEAAGPEERESLFETFDSLVRQLETLGVTADNLRVCALHFCFDWNAGEIAAITGIHRQTIYTRLYRARQELKRRRGAAPLPPANDLQLKLCVGVDLWWSGHLPVAGDGSRNLLLMEQAHAFVKMISLQYPSAPYPHAVIMSQCFFFARLGNASSLYDIITLDRFGWWDRTTWDPRWVAAAKAAYQRYLALQPADAHRLFVDSEFEIYSKPSNDAVDWLKLRRQLDENIRRLPNNTIHTLQAQVISVIDGPAAGARYLEGYSRHERLRDNPVYYLHLARLHYQARHWDKAARHYRKFLVWIRNREWRAVIRRAIDDCAARRKK